MFVWNAGRDFVSFISRFECKIDGRINLLKCKQEPYHVAPVCLSDISDRNDVRRSRGRRTDDRGHGDDHRGGYTVHPG